jgi:hypothetical protein
LDQQGGECGDCRCSNHRTGGEQPREDSWHEHQQPDAERERQEPQRPVVDAGQVDDRALRQQVERRRALVEGERLQESDVRAAGDVEREPGLVESEGRVLQECGEAECDAEGDEDRQTGPDGCACFFLGQW